MTDVIPALLDAIVKSEQWVTKFTRYEYRAAYQAYVNQYGLLYSAAVNQYDNVSQLADELLDALAQHRRKLHFWNRGAAKAEQKMVMVGYLSPMLLGSENEKCVGFAKALCEKWRQRWQDDGYDMAGFEEIVSGFRHSVLGIDLAGKHIGGDKA